MLATTTSVAAIATDASLFVICASSPVDHVGQERNDTGIARLSEPEHRLAAGFAIGIVLRDIHQLVERSALAPLREYEDHLILHLAAVHSRVQAGQLFHRRAALARPE